MDGIGRPIRNTRAYVLDGQGEPVPPGVAGELWLGGAGVARGYLGQSAQTAERFVASRFDAGERLYRSGDLCRREKDGRLTYLGRNDFQVKVRGFRIELGEIEAQLQQCAGVREAVVVARAAGGGERQLVAYWVGEDSIEASTLRGWLEGRLPSYMVPMAYVQLEAWPLTPNGKLDRSALPAPGESARVCEAYTAPEGELETALASIWSELLGVSQVGRDDHFFALGGHSLLAVRLQAMVERRLQQRVTLVDLFRHTTIAQLAAFLRDGGRNVGRVDDSDRRGEQRRHALQQRNRRHTVGRVRGRQAQDTQTLEHAIVHDATDDRERVE